MILIVYRYLILNASRRVEKKEKFGRKHGGLAVYVHNSIARGVRKLPTGGADSILIRLNKDFF